MRNVYLNVSHPEGHVKQSAETVERVEEEDFEDEMIEMLSFRSVILEFSKAMG